MLDSYDFYLGSPGLAGHVEIDAFHGLLNQTLDYLNEHYIGKNSIGDKYALRQAVLPGYNVDEGLKQISISRYGRELFEELAEHLSIKDQVDEMEQYFISHIVHDLPLRSSAQVSAIGRVPISAKQLKEFSAALTQEIARDTEAHDKARKKKERDEAALRKKEDSERKRKAQRAESDRVREELAQAARDARKARAERYAENQAKNERLAEARKANAELVAARKLEMERLAKENPDREKRIQKLKLGLPDPDEYQKRLSDRLKRLEDRRAGNSSTETVAQSLPAPEPAKEQLASNSGNAATASAISLAFLEGRLLIGEARGDTDRWPLEIIVTQFNASTGDWKGTIEWKSLDALHSVEGITQGDTVLFTETEKIKKGKAKVGCRYTLTALSQATRLEGTWSCGQSGSVWIDIK